MRLISTLLFALTFVYSSAPCQNSVYTTYSNYEFENGNVVWKKVFNRKGMSIDSIKNIISASISRDITLEILRSQDNDLFLKMLDKTFEKNGDKLTGLITIEVKEGKYRVIIQEVSRKMGIKTMNTARAFGVAAEVSDHNGITFEDDFINKARTGFKKNGPNLRGLDYYNRLFEAEFDFKVSPTKSKDDW